MTTTSNTSAADLDRIRRAIRDFDFRSLFIEELGWDRFNVAPLAVTVGAEQFTLQPVAQKRVAVFRCEPNAQGGIPDYATRKKIDTEVAKQYHEHFIIYVDAGSTRQIWQWVKRQPGKPAANREATYHKGQTGEPLAQRLSQLFVDLLEDDSLTVAEMAERARGAFDVDKVTKRFYDRFKTEHETFRKAISGIALEDARDWYASLMLNRLMFSYFIQKKGFLDGDIHYLRNRLQQMQARFGADQFHTFYREFLLHLFHDGLGTPEGSRRPEVRALIGNIPYLNGGLFEKHQIERDNPAIAIPDAAFERIFAFFDAYSWHLDDRPMRADNEINPDVLGYIFEKYINQKQMGAYYTKEDITGYISRNTVLPFLFESARKDCSIAFAPDGEVWRLLRDDPDRYIYEAVRKGVDLELPAEIAAGISDVSQRGGWNRPAADGYLLSTETWREHVARRTRCLDLRAKLANGEITAINDLITYNLDIVQFAQDVIERCEGPELLRAFYKALSTVTVLDPTCGSGAFLFAALRLLEPLYEACLLRMRSFVTDFDREGHSQRAPDFRTELKRVDGHPSLSYFIRKEIILRNLYGVDIMEEAVEIAKLRLFLTLVSQVDDARNLEPLPDIDFNIRAGNTLVGFATYKEAEAAVSGNMFWFQQMPQIKQDAEELSRLFARFREQQTTHGGHIAKEDKQNLRDRLARLGATLDNFLAADYGIDEHHIKAPAEREAKLAEWRKSHQPFHWFVEFYAIVQEHGGFDVIIGNPPYVEYSGIRNIYKIQDARFITAPTGNLYAFVWERALRIVKHGGATSFIVPISCVSTPRMKNFVDVSRTLTSSLWLSHYAVRPSKLFVGVDMNLTIIVAQTGPSQPESARSEWTTKYQRWNPEYRKYLFETVAFVEETPAPSLFTFAIPKLRKLGEEVLLGKIRLQKPLSELLSPNKRTTNQQLSYRTAGGRYYKIFLDRPLDSESKSNKTTSLRNDIEVRAILAVLSSNLWWWYYTLHFDMYNCKDYMMFGFPFTYPSDAKTVTVLSRLGEALVDDLFANANRKTQDYATTGERAQLIFVPSRSKPIIDEIDRVLARHYGFTDEELDFIINYDIKYRMGADNSENEEE